MKNIRVLFVVSLVVLAALMAARPAWAEEGPREMVTGYMEALKNRDYVKILHYTGIDVPPEAAALIVPLLEKQTFLTWAVKGYTIKEVKQDGGLATVIVEELHFKNVSLEMRAELSAQAPVLDQAIRWGDNRVTERFVLVRLDGRWQFDGGHSGVQAGPVTSLVTEGLTSYANTRTGGPARPLPSEEAVQRVVGQFVNQIGFGQLMQSFSSAAPVLPPLAAVLIPNFIRARGMGQLTACKSNLKNMGTALEMYSTDNQGRYPPQLSLLTPNYLRHIPTCPAAGVETYSQAYRSATNPDTFTVMCTGSHHAGVGQRPNFPQYTSTQGLISD